MVPTILVNGKATSRYSHLPAPLVTQSLQAIGGPSVEAVEEHGRIVRWSQGSRQRARHFDVTDGQEEP